MAAPLHSLDSIPKKLASIAAIALCAICMLFQSGADHPSPEAVLQPGSLAGAETSQFLASGGLVPDDALEPVGVR